MKISKGKYDDIINLPHHVSKKHPRMSLENRSAQFAPFAALTGYEDEIEETGRITDRKIDISDEVRNILDEKIKKIQTKIYTEPKVTITYFIPDTKKQGGSYKTITSNVIKIDKYKQLIILKDRKEIPIKFITNMDIEESAF